MRSWIYDLYDASQQQMDHQQGEHDRFPGYPKQIGNN